MGPRVAITAFAAALLLAPTSTHAAWPHDPAVNLPVTATPSPGQYLFGSGRVEAVTDGAGGIICIFDDYNAADALRAQRMDAAGNRLWGDAGVLIHTNGTIQQFVCAAVADGAGGVVVAWVDPRGGTQDIYAQRLNSSGSALWTAGGVGVCLASGDQTDVRITGDGSGGAWIAWTDARAGVSTDIYARRVNSSGAAQGAANGIAVCTAAGIQSDPRVTSLVGLSGCVVAWRDQRTDTGDIYAQRLDFGGAAAWAADGVVVCNAASTQSTPALIHDGGTGFVVAWLDYRAGLDLYAQRCNSGGSARWTVNGVPVAVGAANQYDPAIVHDGAGGAVVAYADTRSGGYDVYAQRLSIETGSPQWVVDGVAVCTELGVQRFPLVVADGTGGSYVAWYDLRQNDLGDIYAQRLTSYGSTRWAYNGVGVGVSPKYEYGHSLVSAGPEGCLLQLAHDAVGGPSFVGVQKVDRWGFLGGEPQLVSVTDVPNDEGGQVKVAWNASPLDDDPLFGNVLYDYLVLRSVPTAAAAAALASGAALEWTGGREPAPIGPRRALVRVTTLAGVTSFWETVGIQAAQHLDSYSMVAPTTGDSVAGSNPLTEFMVQARGWNGEWWNSDPLGGYSVDDLAPAAPAPFNGLYSGGTTLLEWGASPEPDLSHYRLYRGVGAFVPSPSNLVATPTTTTHSDAAGEPYVYKLTAVDVHGNESAPATVLPAGAVAVEPPRVARDFFAAPAPQPMRAGDGARLRFGLARTSRVRLALHDVQGRLVSVLADGVLPAGEHSVALAGGSARGAPAPGLYLARLTTPTFTATRRLIVTP